VVAGEQLADLLECEPDALDLDQLERFHELHKAGALSAQEFEAEKRRLLSSVDESASVTQPAPAEN
jgi:hypothetical protein